MTTIKLGNSINDFKQLVSKFEAKEQDLKDVPKKLIDEFGYSCLANSLMFKEPQIPKYDEEGISEYMKTHKFKTIKSLVDYVNSFKNDIDKLFAIFSWEALNIEYDVKLFFSGQHKQTSLNEVFKTKKAVCAGYALFFREMANKANIDRNRFRIEEYSNLAKAFGFDDLNPPKEVKSDHASIYLEIDGVPFIAEPTWAAGSLMDDHKFKWDYNPKLFLIPLYKSLCDHYPCDQAQKLLTFNFPYSDFLKSCKVEPFGRYLKTESNPYVNFESKDGYVEQTYSCTGPIDFASFKIYQLKENTLYEIRADSISSYQIVQSQLPKHPERCRFKTSIAFPDKGFYKVDLYLDKPHILTYFVNCLTKSSLSAELNYNSFHESKFVPIAPTRILTQVKNGYAIIRFAVIPKRSDLIWDIEKLADQNSLNPGGETIDRKCGRFISLQIPFDSERYEDQLCVTFPSNGRYTVMIYLANDIGSYTAYMRYFFDVTGTSKQAPVNPAKYVFKDRTFAPRKITDGKGNEVIIKPNQNCYLVNKKEQTLQMKTANPNDDIHLEFKREDKTMVFVKQSGQEGDFRKFDWTIPDEFGEYHLKGWINDNYCIDLTYIYTNEVQKGPTKEETQLLNEYRSKIDKNFVIPEEKVDNKKKPEQNTANEEVEKKRSSKCCLLI